MTPGRFPSRLVARAPARLLPRARAAPRGIRGRAAGAGGASAPAGAVGRPGWGAAGSQAGKDPMGGWGFRPPDGPRIGPTSASDRARIHRRQTRDGPRIDSSGQPRVDSRCSPDGAHIDPRSTPDRHGLHMLLMSIFPIRNWCGRRSYLESSGIPESLHDAPDEPPSLIVVATPDRREMPAFVRRTARWREQVHHAAKIPRWDHAILSSWWRYA